MSLMDTILGRQNVQQLPADQQQQARSEAMRRFVLGSLLGGRGLASGYSEAQQVIPSMQAAQQRQRQADVLNRAQVTTGVMPNSQLDMLLQQTGESQLDPQAIEGLQRRASGAGLQGTGLTEEQQFMRQFDPTRYSQIAPSVMDPADPQAILNVSKSGAFGAPSPEVRNGRVVLVQRNDFGQERIVEGASPYEATPTEIRTLEALNMPLTMENVIALKRAGSASQVVNVGGESKFGPLQSGYERFTDEQGVVRERPIPGSAAEQEVLQRQQAEQFKQANLERAGGTVVQDIGRVINILGEAGPLATGRGALIGRLDPVSQASQIEDLVSSVRGNIGVDQLQQMRNASPTGGALGNVTERQLEGLQGLLGSLKVTGDRRILEDNLKRISNIYMDTIHGTPDAIRRLGPERGLTPQQIQALAERYDLSFDERGRRSGDQRQTQPQRQSLDQIFGR